MASTSSAVAILPVDLGDASTYDQDVFPVEYYQAPDNFSKGTILMKTTLEEMEMIKTLGIDLNKNEDFIFNTRLDMEALKVQKKKLQDSGKTLNPFKAFRKYRAARLFHAGSRDLYLRTLRTSEKIQREEGHVRVVPNTQMKKANGAIPPGATISGFVVDLPDGWNDGVERTINDARETMATTNPFQDNSRIPQLDDDEHEISLANTESLLSQDVSSSGAGDGNQTPLVSSDPQPPLPTSPPAIGNIWHIHYQNSFQNSVVTTNSHLDRFTYNHGSRNSGASTTQESVP